MKNLGGRPTKYNEGIVQQVNDYIKATEIPYIEEIALELDIDLDTVAAWREKYPQFSRAIKRLRMKQLFKLQKISYSKDFNPAGAIFQLKANHGMIETEKRILEGDLNFSIIDSFDSKDE